MKTSGTIGYRKHQNNVTFEIVVRGVPANTWLSNEVRLSSHSRSAAVKTAKEEAVKLGADYIGDMDRIALGEGAFDLDALGQEAK